MKTVFRPLENLPDSFAPLLLRWRNSEAVRAQMLRQGMISEEEHRRWYSKVISEDSSYLVRVAFYEGNPFGVVYLTDIDHDTDVASWGLYIGEESFRGRGLGRPMLAELLFWGFEELALYRMYTSVLEGNEGAMALYRLAGFQIEGVWRQHVLCKDKRRDLIWIGMLRDEWEAVREKAEEWRNQSLS